MTDYAWSIGRDLVKGCGALSGIQITPLDAWSWFVVDRRGQRIKASGPFSSNAAARAAVEQRESAR